MTRWIRYLVFAVIGGLAVLGVVFALAWMFMPREWIEREAQSQASKMTGAQVRWRRLEPAFQDWSLGVRLRDLTVRMPAVGDPDVDARAQEIFVRMRLLPLLFRKVEVAAASVKGVWITSNDRGAREGGTGAPAAGAPAALILPRVDFENVNVRTRDQFGGGIELTRLSGHTEIEGPVSMPVLVRIDARAEALVWKPSAREGGVALPGPLLLDVALASKEKGKRLEVTQGSIRLGPLESSVQGAIRMQGASGDRALSLGLVIEGKPQEIRSDHAAWKALAAKRRATWKGVASWKIKVTGDPTVPSTEGALTVKPLSITAARNAVSLDVLQASWTTRPDQTYRANARGSGRGITMTLDAQGSTAPGGASHGTLLVRAPAARLNGLVPNAPTWESGDVECRAVFEVSPPNKPKVQWIVKGRGLIGRIQGLTRPVKGLEFDLSGDMATVEVRSMKLTVGSTTARVTGAVKQGKPLGTGTFRVALDRFVAEEWTSRAGTKGAPGQAGAPAPPQIPLHALDAVVEIGEVRSGGMRIVDMTAPVRLSGRDLSVAPIKGTIGRGTLDGSLTVKSLAANPGYHLHVDVNRAPVEEFVSGTLPFHSAVTGLLSGVLDLRGPGLPGPEAAESLVGTLSGSVEDGKILPSPTLSKLTGALGLRGGDSDMAFRKLTHSVRIASGRMLLDKIRCELGTDLAEMNGSVGLDHTLDLNLLLRLAPSRVKGGGTLAEIVRYARDEEGRVPIELKIGGTDRAPTVSLKPGRAMDMATKQLQRELKADLTRRLSRAKSDSAQTDSTANDPSAKGRDALRRLLGK